MKKLPMRARYSRRMSALDLLSEGGSGCEEAERGDRVGVSMRAGGAGASEVIRGDDSGGWLEDDDANVCTNSIAACLRDNTG
jgi:hypothetical protein